MPARAAKAMRGPHTAGPELFLAKWACAMASVGLWWCQARRLIGECESSSSQGHPMANPPRRPTNPMTAAEAAFKPVKKPVAPPREPSAAPGVRELVSIRIDRTVLDHFQADGPGWQDRINDALRQAIEGKPVASGSDDD